MAALDLTAIGQNLTPEQWYDGLAVRLARQLSLEDAMELFWRQNQRLGAAQRFFAALRDLVLEKVSPPSLKATPGDRAEPGDASPRLVIFVDEIDTVRSLLRP